MFETTFQVEKGLKAILVSLVCPTFTDHTTESDTKRSLNELEQLSRTLGLSPEANVIQNRKSIDPGTVLGRGKIVELKERAQEVEADILIFDFELTAGQVKNIKNLTKMTVIDRCHIILEIFAKHAQTNEAKIQIEIAKLKYLLPRLSGFWGHLSRQRGGVGVKGGEGEQQIELDRRMIRQRIEFLKDKMKTVAIGRKEQRKKREKKAITAALVGYTNAGKSSLMNRLCRADVLEEDKLFATLDSTFRMLNPDTRPPMILIDTVGFLSNLPNTLIEGFRTTLESAGESDLLIIVCDISDPNYQKQLSVTEEVLSELDLGKKERLIVFNKKDQLNDPLREKVIKRAYPNSFVVSSFDENDIDALRDHIIAYFLEKQDLYELFIPYEVGDAHSKIVGNTNIIGSRNHEKGIYYKVRAPEFIFSGLRLNSFLLGPQHQY